MFTDTDPGMQALAAERLNRQIEDARLDPLYGRHLPPMPPITVAGPTDPRKWQPMTAEAKAKVRAKMTAWYGAPGERLMSEQAQKVLDETVARRNARMFHPLAPKDYVTPSGRREALDMGVSVQRERPPAGVTNGDVTWFEAASGLPLDPESARRYCQITNCPPPATLELVIEGWWDVDLDQVRWRPGEVRFVAPLDPEPGV